jgi:putative transposase
MSVEDKAIPFCGFDEHGEVCVYEHGILPHWRQAGCTYFVTFRLADSLPKAVTDRLKDERDGWLRRHGIDPDNPGWQRAIARLKPATQREFERTVGERLNEALDRGYGSCQLREPALAEIVAAALTFFDGTRVRTGDFVVMPNHVHTLITPIAGFELADILHSIKSFTSNQIRGRIGGGEGSFWQRQSYDHIVRDFAQLRRFQDYIRRNPEKASLPQGEYLLREAVYEEL